MGHQNGFAHAESDGCLMAGKMQVGWPPVTSSTVSRSTLSRKVLGHVPQTHSALIDGSRAFFLG